MSKFASICCLAALLLPAPAVGESPPARGASKSPPTGSAASDGGLDSEGYVAFDPSARPSVSGKRLLVIATAAVLGVLFLYTAALYRRQKRVNRDLFYLAKELGIDPADRGASVGNKADKSV